MSADIAGKSLEEKTVEGGMLKIDATGMGVKVGQGMVETPNVAADNGVIHIVN